MNHPHNLYFHVPFCDSKCRYCAFYSTACANPDWDGYCGRILSELDRWHAKLGHAVVPTIFFGGGTPSLMPSKVFARIINYVRHKFDIVDDAEITLESNPGTIGGDRLAEFRSAGMNRLSIGIQSLKIDDLEFLGRRHDVAAAIRLIQDARNLGLRVSGDFIYGLPGQTVGDVENLCRQINELGLEHCSMYELSIEPGTPFARMSLEMPDNGAMASMYEVIGKTLALPRYEVSNYATSGAECRHNRNIWNGQPYIGVGRGAAGRLLMGGVWYEQMGANQKFDEMDGKTRALENIIMGLRTLRGVVITPDVRDIMNWDFVRQHPELLELKSDNRIAATEKGILILNNLLVNLVK
ncbi:MAG: radical SAM family heme chaperone HemW [Rickettsiales bacterium]|jgi:oxygen-independent coproporphyrinogen-3 oxidase|nr:radical SAM family heme chaperone HemW [Rickettsiales bacterium]